MGIAGKEPLRLTLEDQADDSFVTCWPEQALSEVLATLAGTHSRYLVVLLGAGQAHVAEATLFRLRHQRSEAETVGQALGAALEEPTPRRPAGTPVVVAPPLCLVYDGALLLGIYDAEADLGPFRSASRYHRVTVEHDRSVRLRETAGVMVSLEKDELPERLQQDTELPDGTEVEVRLATRHGLETAGPVTGRLRVGPDRPPSLLFELRGTELGTGVAELVAFVDGREVVRLLLEVEVVVDPSGCEDGLRALRSVSVAPPEGPEADLYLLVTEQRDGDGVMLSYELRTRDDDPVSVGPALPGKRLSAAARQQIDSFLEICRHAPDSDDDGSWQQQVESMGYGLFTSVVPQPVREILWRHRASRGRGGTPWSILIQSQDVLIPWELCRLFGREGNREVTGEFLCESFSVGRWRPGAPPPHRVAVDDPRPSVLLVEGRSDSELDPLDIAGEASHFAEMQGAPAEFISGGPPKLRDIIESVRKGEHAGYHFIGHGAANRNQPDRSEFYLSGRSYLTPAHVQGPRNLGEKRTFVFLNGCETGRNDQAMTDKGGWAMRFLDAGAAAFVGTAWRVRSQSSRRFAEHLYSRMFTGVPLGEAVRQARLQVKKDFPGQPCWLAYTLFAHPLAVWAAAAGTTSSATDELVEAS